MSCKQAVSRLGRTRPKLLILGLTLLTVLPGALARPSEWPQLEIPDQVAIFGIAEEFEANSVPMRIVGFSSPFPQREVLAAFKSRLGSPAVETGTSKSRVLGKALGEVYVTIQVEQAGRASRGVITMTRPLQSFSQVDAAKRELRHAIDLLPSGTRVISHTQSRERGARVETFVLVNEASQAYNTERVTALLRARGLVREHPEGSVRDLGTGQTIWFRGAHQEGSAVIRPTAQGGALVLITIAKHRGGGN